MFLDNKKTPAMFGRSTTFGKLIKAFVWDFHGFPLMPWAPCPSLPARPQPPTMCGGFTPPTSVKVKRMAVEREETHGKCTRNGLVQEIIYIQENNYCGS